MRRFWADDEIAVLCDMYPNTATTEVAQLLDRSVKQVHYKAYKLGLKKSAEFLKKAESGRFVAGEKTGQATWFKKGLTPWNKGKAFNPGGRSAETRFKKGNKPSSWLPIGSERRTKDGILERKVSDTGVKKTDWVPVHVLIWEERNGPVPPGSVVVFADLNRDNFNPANLECITRAELMHRNNRHNRYPEDLNQLIQLRGVLTRKINQRAKA